MVCEHLRHLYQLCITQEIRLSSSELVRFVCKQCDTQETCPSNLMEYGDDLYDIQTEDEAAAGRSTQASEASTTSHS